MTTIQIRPDTQVGVDEIVNGVASLDTPDLEIFLQRISQLLATRKAPHFSSEEAELLIKINAGYPTELKQKYRDLLAKKAHLSISPAENKELEEMIDEFEVLDSKRLEYLIELAQIRRQPLDILLKSFGELPKYES
jgi:hypothetical protein